MTVGRVWWWCAQRVLVLSLLLGASAASAQDPFDPDVEEDVEEGTSGPDAGTSEPAVPEEAPVEAEPAPEAPVEGEVVDPDAGAPFPGEGEIAPPLGEEVVPEEEPLPADSGEMVVTGSRIRRSNFAQPSAVQIVDRKALAASGAQNMTDVIKNMNINSGSDLNTNVNSASPGSAQFNLRGLGISSTLVLLNGRRMTTIGAGTEDGSAFVDINSIPLGVIERIEVLKGGASAIYGSDAVAGVVNIITRKHMDGFEAQVGGQTTDNFDQHEWDVSLLGGAQGERTRVMGGITYFRREPLMADDRDFTKNGRNTSTLGWPSVFLQLNPATGGALLDMNNRPVSYQDPGCGNIPLSSPSTDPTRALDFCLFNFNPYYVLLPNEERVTFYTTVQHDVSDHTMAFIELGYARSRVSRQLSPSYPLLQPFIVPADHAYNPTGTPLRWYGRIAGGNSPGYMNDYDSDTFHTVAGIGGDFGGIIEDADDFQWELAGTWSGNRYQVLASDVITANLRTALNSCGPGHDPEDCWNPFSFGAPNSQQLVDRVTGELRTLTDVSLTTVGLDFTGPLFELPGGDLSFAIGGQMRKETAEINPDHESNQEAFAFLVGGPDWEAERQIWAGYGELLLPFFRGFELQAAGRIESYDDMGESFDPMLGVSWTPATTIAGDEAAQAAKVRLRGTYATSFRAPSLLQGNGALTALQEIFPVANVNGQPTRARTATYTAVRTFGNPDLDPQKSTAITAGFEWLPVNGLMLDADYWNYDYQEIIVRENAQQKVDADFATKNSPDIVYDEATGAPTRINVRFINAESVMTHGIDLGATYRTNFGAQAGTFSFGVNGSYVLAYEIPQSAVPPALWNESIAGCSAPNTAPDQPPPADATCDVAGLMNNNNFARSLPRLRLTVPIGWNMDGHTVALIANYTGSYHDDFDSDSAPPDAEGSHEDYRPIDSFLTLDLQYAIEIEESDTMSTTVRIGVINLLDSDPPPVNIGLGYDFNTHDPRGRILYARLIQEF